MKPELNPDNDQMTIEDFITEEPNEVTEALRIANDEQTTPEIIPEPIPEGETKMSETKSSTPDPSDEAQASETKYYSVEEASKILGVGLSTFRRYAQLIEETHHYKFHIQWKSRVYSKTDMRMLKDIKRRIQKGSSTIEAVTQVCPKYGIIGKNDIIDPQGEKVVSGITQAIKKEKMNAEGETHPIELGAPSQQVIIEAINERFLAIEQLLDPKNVHELLGEVIRQTIREEREERLKDRSWFVKWLARRLKL